jgi:hypothetical protein
LADHTKTISESINVFGLAPSTKWNEFSWGTGKWGEGSSGLFKVIGKFLVETQASTDAIYRHTIKRLTETQSVTMIETDTKLTDGSGYSYVFPGGATDAEEQVITDFTRQSAGSTSWTKQSAGGTSWS